MKCFLDSGYLWSPVAARKVNRTKDVKFIPAMIAVDHWWFTFLFPSSRNFSKSILWIRHPDDLQLYHNITSFLPSHSSSSLSAPDPWLEPSLVSDWLRPSVILASHWSLDSPEPPAGIDISTSSRLPGAIENWFWCETFTFTAAACPYWWWWYDTMS